MPGPDPIRLCFGMSRRLKFAHVLIALAGLLAILQSPAGWPWQAGSLLLLGCAVGGLYAWFAWRPQRGVMLLLPDGTAEIQWLKGSSRRVALDTRAWATRWFCVLPLLEAENGRHHHCVVCASENRPDAYRRLLVTLRMRTSPTIVERTGCL
ncbi:MAG: hypothetical protein HKN57_02850 [Xanthomonadales bacterium]|nr:hypothetical protein [Gammaproteobacteria bacterium]MBT8052773.1 hypothetical protein [Gammaproteobacteria bacterium]NND56164.1 hypothetical protein [Xanthomonadales bacterium]NNK50569.1 hypothetical protein [Xanthomonadales bacterium]